MKFALMFKNCIRKKGLFNSMLKIRLISFTGLFYLILIISLGCVPKYTQIPQTVPVSFSTSGKASLNNRWWENFHDDELNNIIEKALLNNFDILTSWDRIDQAAAILGISKASELPVLQTEMGSKTIRINGGGSGIPPSGGTDGSTSNQSFSSFMYQEGTTYSLSISASYEIDIWGRIRAAKRAAKNDFLASSEALQSTAMMVASSISLTWYELIEKQMELHLLHEQINLNKSYLKLIKLRYSEGMISFADVLQQEQQLASTEGQVQLVLSRKGVLLHQLAILSGLTPQEFQISIPEKLPVFPPLPETGLPADLVLRRPDLISTYYRLKAADDRLAEALANRFPRLSIVASGFDEDEKIRSLFTNWIATFAANLTAPLFDGRRRKNEVVRNRAIVSERLHTFEKTAINAFKEVEDALLLEKRQRNYIVSINKQLTFARKALTITKERFKQGVIDYLRVLTSLQTLQRLEIQSLDAVRNQFSFRIKLYQALGGGWKIERKKEN